MDHLDSLTTKKQQRVSANNDQCPFHWLVPETMSAFLSPQPTAHFSMG